MDYAEFKRQLGKAGISIKDFASLLKLQPTSISNYARAGKVSDHLAVIACLMGEMAENGLDYRHTIEQLVLEPNRPRGGRQAAFQLQQQLFDLTSAPISEKK